ncbi:MAG TPA: nucleotidyltransferase domain-containing protein [Saprospiraceae bacterium]|nr:nucleotidyltransferase domain-containing protein [Saprospiraceae bacterium]
MTERKDILNYIERHKAELMSKYHLSKIGVIGSLAHREQTSESDIDLIVEFETGTENLFQIKQALRQLFKNQFHLEVDICREKYIKPYYKKQILEDAVFV